MLDPGEETAERITAALERIREYLEGFPEGAEREAAAAFISNAATNLARSADSRANHEAVITPGSFRRAGDDTPLEPPLQGPDFPALAECRLCGGRLRKQTSTGTWTHDDNEQ